MRRLATLGVLLLGLFLVLGKLVSGAAPGVDVAVADTLGGDWQGTAGRVAYAGSLVLGPVLPAVAALGLVVAALVNRGRPRLMGLLLRCVLLLAVCRAVSLVKPVFDRARPRDYPDFSFPSGHVVSVASVAFTAVVLCAWLAAHRLRLVVAVSAVAVVVAALCRVLLDVHWLTDVVGATVGVVAVGLLAGVALRLLPARTLGG
ncbi:phosphatase PAP2 family protein [Actinokineospora diospyrosa]|uniref:Undecaprenyl-diphosphatase n=1 Tax=Actinokineospora diospyrosa TaxID=103728 RepID=A0ABT1IB78_9PSEU|nr:phosphatase PAP2 family protein [Actinokineospora diospyrosa]MCP2269890.1 undecaprenyl-diphosphatase [Actinokineospora diospyrosa]